MQMLYGSNAGTCESLAQSLANTATSHGYAPRICPLDEATGNVPKDQAVTIVILSYEGEPPDNAVHFIEWLGNLQGNELKFVYWWYIGILFFPLLFLIIFLENHLLSAVVF